MLGDVLLGIVSLCTLVSYLPQAIKLIKTQESNDLSTTSWIIWVVSSFSYLLYAFLCSNEFNSSIYNINNFVLTFSVF